MKALGFLASVTAAVALSACSTASMPALDGDTPQDWGAAATGEWPGEEWWSAFGSEELHTLMQQVQERNLGLENAERSLRQAQLALIDAGFDLYPTPVVSFNASGSYSGFAPPGGEFRDGASDSGSLALSLSYADILSKPYRFEAAEAAYESAAAQLAATRLNLQGTAASTYFRILYARDQIEAARLNLQNAEAIERITRRAWKSANSRPSTRCNSRSPCSGRETRWPSCARKNTPRARRWPCCWPSRFATSTCRPPRWRA